MIVGLNGVNMKFLKQFFSIVAIELLLNATSQAVSSRENGFGNIANNLFRAEMNVRQILQVICIASGVGMILSAIIRYKKHRANPLAFSLGSVITNVVIGGVLILLAFIPLLA